MLFTPRHHYYALKVPRGSRNDVIIQQARMRIKIKDFCPSEGKNQRKVRMRVKVKHFYFVCNRHLVQKMLTARMRCWMTYNEILLYRIKHTLGNRICQGESALSHRKSLSSFPERLMCISIRRLFICLHISCT